MRFRIISDIVLRCFSMLIIASMYLPIVVLTIFSFNDRAFPYQWHALSFKWYKELLCSQELIVALNYSLGVALSATVLSIGMSLLFLFYGSRSFLKDCTPVLYSTIFIPEIVIAVGLLSLFNFLAIPKGILTLIVAHTLIGLAFAIPVLSTRFKELQTNVIEASLDLGASFNQTFIWIVIPLMRNAIIAASLLVFVLSFDDYIIAFFCTANTVQTLPLLIFSMIRNGVSPTVNALSVLLLGSSIIILLLVNYLQGVKKIAE